MLKLLVDADILIHKAGHACTSVTSETFDSEDTIIVEDLEMAKVMFIGHLDEIRAEFFPEDCEVFLAVTVGKTFRNSISAEYKSHRPAKPEIIKRLQDWVIGELGGISHPGIEADDILGMHQDPKGSTVICSEDKDLLQIPGRHYNWRSKTKTIVTPYGGMLSFFFQVLTGDSTDGYKGCPRIGPDQATKALAGAKTKKDFWDRVKNLYLLMGSTEEKALENARLAYILHPEDEPDYLWSPE